MENNAGKDKRITMSLNEPSIDKLLENTDYDRFMLCSIAAKRSKDINDMLLGYRDRTLSTETALKIAQANIRKPLTIALDEIAKGDISYDRNPQQKEKKKYESTNRKEQKERYSKEN